MKDSITSHIADIASHTESLYLPEYNDIPRECYTLNSTYYVKSLTQIIPFVIAHECNIPYTNFEGYQRVRERQYYVFHDVIHYMIYMNQYPHSHELLRGVSMDSKLKGRIVFDFDIVKKYYNNEWVKDDFYTEVKRMISIVLSTFYDIKEELKMIWSRCEHEDKYSRHLTISNMYLSEDWVEQLSLFYLLCNYIIVKANLFSYMGSDATSIIDMGIPHTHATLRMPFNSKLNGNKFIIEEWRGVDSFYDSLIECYNDKSDMIYIETSSLDKRKIYEILGIKCDKVNKRISKFDTSTNRVIEELNFLQLYNAKRDINHFSNNNLSNRYTKSITSISSPNKYLYEVLKKLDGYKNEYEDVDIPNDVMREIKSVVQSNKSISLSYKIRKIDRRGIITLDRIKPSKCLLRDKVHDRQGAYLSVSGDSIRFFCGRGCYNSHGVKFIVIGRFSSSISNIRDKSNSKAKKIYDIPKPKIIM